MENKSSKLVKVKMPVRGQYGQPSYLTEMACGELVPFDY